MLRPRRFLVLLLSLCAAAVAGAACSGSNTSGTASPTPSASPFVPVGCQIIWANNTADPNKVDYYIVDGPVSRMWRAGTTSASFFIAQAPLALTSTITGALVRGFSLLDGSRAAAMIATAGTFQVTLSQTSALAIGSSVGFQDTTSQHYYLITTAGGVGADQGASGTGSFSGTWSNPFDPNVAPGTGTVSLTFQGSALTLGVSYSYARCYETRPKPIRPPAP